jgi:hypothetical protein
LEEWKNNSIRQEAENRLDEALIEQTKEYDNESILRETKQPKPTFPNTLGEANRTTVRTTRKP